MKDLPISPHIHFAAVDGYMASVGGGLIGATVAEQVADLSMTVATGATVGEVRLTVSIDHRVVGRWA